jgi:hypothetical protein
MKRIIFGLFFLYGISLFAQSDKGVSAKEIPAQASAYIEAKFKEHSKIVYYKEVEDDSICFVANFKYESHKYSVMFSQAGEWIETEIQVSFEKFPENIEKAIEEKLIVDFSTYKIKQTQEVDNRGTLLYELEVRGKKHGDKEVLFYEYYFDRNGVFVKVEPIALKAIPSMF